MKVSNLYYRRNLSTYNFFISDMASPNSQALTCGMKDWQNEGRMKLHHLSLTVVLNQWAILSPLVGDRAFCAGPHSYLKNWLFGSKKYFCAKTRAFRRDDLLFVLFTWRSSEKWQKIVDSHAMTFFVLFLEIV